MTIDNCSTNNAVINIIIDKLQRSSLVMRGSMLHMRCAVPVLNLIVQDRLVSLDHALSRFVIVWGFGRHQQREGKGLKKLGNNYILNVPKN